MPIPPRRRTHGLTKKRGEFCGGEYQSPFTERPCSISTSERNENSAAVRGDHPALAGASARLETARGRDAARQPSRRRQATGSRVRAEGREPAAGELPSIR